MEYLKGRNVYLSGAIEDAVDDGSGWRNQIKEKLEKHFGLDVIKPSDKDRTFQMEHPVTECTEEILKLRKEEDYDELSRRVRWIRHADLRLVDRSDFVICKLFTTIKTHGTWEELTLANSQKKPILVWANMGKKEAPGWLFGMIPHETIFSSLEGIIEYLDRIDEGDIDEPNQERWLL